jgi:hypothetical protein
MATQNCPRCKGGRIRLGYRPTPFFQKILWRYNLLCNDCNWEFIGFAIPGTISSKVKRKNKVSPIEAETNLNSDTERIINEITLLAKSAEETDIEPTDNNYSQLPSSHSIDLFEQKNNLEIDNNKDKPAKRNKVKKRVRVKLT